MTVRGKGGMENVPLHGTIEMMTKKGKDGTERTFGLASLSGTMTPDCAQSNPALATSKYKDREGKERVGFNQIISESQAKAIMEAAGDNKIALNGKDGKPNGKTAVAFSADLMRNSQGTGLMPNTAKPMGENKIATAAGFGASDEGARKFMSEQRDMASQAFTLKQALIKEQQLDMATQQGRAQVPDFYNLQTGQALPKAPTLAEERAAKRDLPKAPPEPKKEAEEEAGLEV